MLRRRTTNPPLRTWAGMGVVGLACLAANLGLAIGSAAARDCKLIRLGSADLSVLNDRILVQVTINDHPARMLLDLASVATLVERRYVNPLGLQVRSLSSHALHYDNLPITQITELTSFGVGSLLFGKAGLFVFPDDAAPSAESEPIVGRVGMDALRDIDFELDFSNQKLNFYSPDHCTGAVVYWTDNYSSAELTRGPLGNYYFPIELEGKKVEASLSTLGETTRLGTQVTQRLYGFDENSKDVETQTDSAGHPVAHFRAMALTGRGITIRNAQIELVTGKADLCSLSTKFMVAHYEDCKGAEAPLRLGLNVARRLHLYFATKERVLYFSDAAATK